MPRSEGQRHTSTCKIYEYDENRKAGIVGTNVLYHLWHVIGIYVINLKNFRIDDGLKDVLLSPCA